MMKRIVFVLVTLVAGFSAVAQEPVDSTEKGKVTVIKDPRLEILARKEQELNESLASGLRNVKGYRLLVLNSNDRNYAMKVRAQLLQNFPDQKVYMAFQSPYIKLKMGNFVEKSEAEKYRDMITRGKIVTSNVYLVPEMVEVRLDKKEENQ